MRRSLHLEYNVYLQDVQADERCRHAVAAWRASGAPVVVAPYGLHWTAARAEAFVRSLARMFVAYNRVLWDRFPYCRGCLGRCCEAGAVQVDGLDLMALALLGERLPVLSGQAPAAADRCVYLVQSRCGWPVAWRTAKCWAFYCLGPERDAAPGQYQTLAAALAPIIREHLPDELGVYERISGETLLSWLEQPLEFVYALRRAASAILVQPFHEQYPFWDRTFARGEATNAGAPADQEDQVLELIEQVSEWLSAAGPPPSESGVHIDQLLSDLELLEWIVWGRPAHSNQMLDEMYRRYEGLPAGGADRWRAVAVRLRDHVARLRAQ